MPATSRASPRIERRSPRFGFTSMSITSSPRRSTSRMPSGALASRMRIPSPSSVAFSSLPEQSIPSEVTPIFSARSMSRPSGITEPTRATGTRWPGAMFFAPQTTLSVSLSEIRTFVSCNRSARGCGPTSSSSPTTNVLQSAPHRSKPRTSRPRIMSASASCSFDSSMSTNSRSQESGTLISCS